MSKSKIEWTGHTWNPIMGCTKVSPGCANCYAERMARRLQAMKRRGYDGVVNKRGRWTGKITLAEWALDNPLQWKKPRIIFVNSMSDLFHNRVPLGYIQRVFRVMNDCPQHTFQILTKRPEAAARYACKLRWSSNIWMGTSVEDARALDRIKYLIRIPARIRFLSCEPLLGPLNFCQGLNYIDWVIVGCESGPGRRATKYNWVRHIKDQCVEAGVPFFLKQLSYDNVVEKMPVFDGRVWDQMPEGITT